MTVSDNMKVCRSFVDDLSKCWLEGTWLIINLSKLFKVLSTVNYTLIKVWKNETQWLWNLQTHVYLQWLPLHVACMGEKRQITNLYYKKNCISVPSKRWFSPQVIRSLRGRFYWLWHWHGDLTSSLKEFTSIRMGKINSWVINWQCNEY